MTTQEEGMEYADVRNEWPREDLDFTPWLAKNLDVLRDAVGVQLKLIQKEKQVGRFYCDILALEVDSDVKVVIENQLEVTDHNHLGQLLTYAAGLDAKIAVWVATDWLYEHAMALHRLNESTHSDRKFYGIKVMVLKTGNASEIRLCRVVTPDGLNKCLTLSPSEVDTRKQRFNDFFEPLIQKLNKIDGFPSWVTKAYGPADRLFRWRPDSGIRYAASLESNGYAWVTLQIRMEKKEHTNAAFEKLFEHKKNVEACIPDQDWKWYKHENRWFSSINIRRTGSIDDPPEKLEETRTWMLDILPRLKEVFDPHVASIPGSWRPKSDG